MVSWLQVREPVGPVGGGAAAIMITRIGSRLRGNSVATKPT
jgi:hypothetical protein